MNHQIFESDWNNNEWIEITGGYITTTLNESGAGRYHEGDIVDLASRIRYLEEKLLEIENDVLRLQEFQTDKLKELL